MEARATPDRRTSRPAAEGGGSADVYFFTTTRHMARKLGSVGRVNAAQPTISSALVVGCAAPTDPTNSAPLLALCRVVAFSRTWAVDSLPHEDHVRLAGLLRGETSPWLLSYD